MNERIKELAEQATSKPHRSQGFGGEPTHIYPGTLDPEKFAELIIKECFDVVINDGRFHDAKGIIRAGKYTAMEHFGVEE